MQRSRWSSVTHCWCHTNFYSNIWKTGGTALAWYCSNNQRLIKRTVLVIILSLWFLQSWALQRLGYFASSHKPPLCSNWIMPPQSSKQDLLQGCTGAQQQQRWYSGTHGHEEEAEVWMGWKKSVPSAGSSEQSAKKAARACLLRTKPCFSPRQWTCETRTCSLREVRQNRKVSSTGMTPVHAVEETPNKSNKT